jgi:hypothetical protein
MTQTSGEKKRQTEGTIEQDVVAVRGAVTLLQPRHLESKHRIRLKVKVLSRQMSVRGWKMGRGPVAAVKDIDT